MTTSVKQAAKQSPLDKGECDQHWKVELVKNLHSALEKPVRLVSTTSGIDRCIRLTSYSMRTLKAFELIKDVATIKKIDMLSSRLSATRYILRWTRKWIIINDLVNKGFKAESIRKTLDIIFKLYILVSDFNDIIHYIHYIKIRDNESAQVQFRKMNLDFYFIECCLWLCFYTHDLSKQPKENKARRKQLVLYIIKYILDILVSHNDFSKGFFKLNPKPIAFFGFLSSVIAMYISWK